MTLQMIYDLTFQNATKNNCNLKLFKIPQKEISKICRIRDYQVNQSLVFYKGWFYSDLHKFSPSANKMIHLDNRVSEKAAKKFLEKIKRNHLKFSSVINLKFYLIGTKIYYKYCKKSNLTITQTGNTLFGDWWTLDVGLRHHSLKNTKFTRKNFERELEKAKKFVNSKPSRLTHGRKIFFTYPKIQWFEGSENL